MGGLNSKGDSCGANRLRDVDVASIGIDGQEGIWEDDVVDIGDCVLRHLHRLFEGQEKV